MSDTRSNAAPFGIARRTRAAALCVVVSLTLGSTATAQARAGAEGAASEQRTASTEKRDSMTITIPALKRTEVKLEMTKGQKAKFSWKADGSEVTFNLHGEGPKAPRGKAHTYARGSSRGETGEIVALFDGDHGWSWRNTSGKPVRIVVTATGQFQKLKQL